MPPLPRGAWVAFCSDQPLTEENDNKSGRVAIFSKILSLLGLGAPFLYALTVFLAFNFLDKRASAQAKRAISQWLKSAAYNKAHVADATVEIFDRLYTCPLFGWRAFLRALRSSRLR